MWSEVFYKKVGGAENEADRSELSVNRVSKTKQVEFQERDEKAWRGIKRRDRLNNKRYWGRNKRKKSP